MAVTRRPCGGEGASDTRYATFTSPGQRKLSFRQWNRRSSASPPLISSGKRPSSRRLHVLRTSTRQSVIMSRQTTRLPARPCLGTVLSNSGVQLNANGHASASLHPFFESRTCRAVGSHLRSCHDSHPGSTRRRPRRSSGRRHSNHLFISVPLPLPLMKTQSATRRTQLPSPRAADHWRMYRLVEWRPVGMLARAEQ
jgi:hypothetical protein